MDDGATNLEDWRGVDIGQIRELLQLSVADRAAEMVRVSNLVIEAQHRVKAAKGMDSA